MTVWVVICWFSWGEDIPLEMVIDSIQSTKEKAKNTIKFIEEHFNWDSVEMIEMEVE